MGSSSWWSDKDMCLMKDRSKCESYLLEWGHFNHDRENVTSRGLEGRTRNGTRQRWQNRMDAWEAVFDEINWQEEEDFFDDVAIAEAYFPISEACAHEARLIAECDELEARI